MTTPVPAGPVPQELAAHLVASPVSAAAFGRVLCSQLAFLLGRNLPVIASCASRELGSGSTAVTIPLQWRPSPGCRVAAVRVDLGQATSFNVVGGDRSNAAHATIALTLPTGATMIPGALLGLSTALDGSTACLEGDINVAARAAYGALISLGVPGGVSDAVRDITITIDDVGTEQHSGALHVSLVEVPLATLRPQDNEPGVLFPWIDARNVLADDDGAVGAGVPVFLTAERDASTRVRTHWQVFTYEDTGNAATRSSATVGALDWLGGVGTNDPVWRVRVPAVYGRAASAVATFTLRIRYRSTSQGTFRVVRTPRGGSTTNADTTIASTGGTWATHSATVTLGTDGTDGEIDLKFHAATDDASALYVSSILLVQTESA